MGLDLKKRREKEQADLRPLVIDLGDGESLNILYRKNRVTVASATRMSELMKAAQAAQKSGASNEASAQAGLLLMETQIDQFLDAVVSWDATDDGEPVPLTREGLAAAEVDLELIAFIQARITEDSRPNEMTGPK